MENIIPLLKLLLVTPWFVGLVQGHGRLLEPPSRSSMWRLGYKTPKNYEDNQLFCGGVGVQYRPGVDGRCGVCGDPWNGPRKHEAGGKFATGTIVRKYEPDQVINVTVELTANHKGYFEFRLCPSDNPFEKVTWECLNKYILEEAATGRTQYMVEKQNGYKKKIQIKLRLPVGVKCRACMLQWKYNAGNSWGTGIDGTGCIGCGNQEQFYACADVAIGHDDVVLGKAASKSKYFKETGDEWTFGTGNSNNTSGNSGHRIWLKETMLHTCLAISVFFVTLHKYL